MDDDGIGIVLCRASELRSKIANCIDKASSLYREGKSVDEREEERQDRSYSLPPSPTETVVEVSEPDEEAESLVQIRDALESLESQLTSLQALQQQQQYEREAALADIDYSRKMLLEKLNEYKGKDLQVINEASTFASEAVEHNNDLLLPPYPSRAPHSLALGNGYVSQFPSTRMLVRNGVNGIELSNEAKKSMNNSDKTQTNSLSKSSQNGLRSFLGVATKTVIAFVGVVSVLSLAGFEPKLGKHTTRIVLGPLRRSGTEERRSTTQCPPGKVLVMEDGEARCLVKERVEIPFETVVTKPDVKYGFG